MRVDPSKTIPTTTDPAEVWIEWHKALKKWFSKNEANSHFVRFWSARAGAGAQADSYAVRHYMEDQGVNLTTDASGRLTDSVRGIGEFFSDTIVIVRNILLIVLALGASYLIYKWVSGVSTGIKAAKATSTLKQLT